MSYVSLVITTVVLFITTSNWCLMFHYCDFIYCYLYLVSYVSLLWFYLLLLLIGVLCFTTVVLFIATSNWCLMFHYCRFIYCYLYLVSYVSLLWFYLLLPLFGVLCFTTVVLSIATSNWCLMFHYCSFEILRYRKPVFSIVKNSFRTTAEM